MQTPITHKFVAVLNKKIPTPVLMNALAHMAAGLVARCSGQLALMRFDSYYDKDGNEHPSISDNPFIILIADNSNKIRTLRKELLPAGICFVDFTNTMVTGGFEQQKEQTKNTSEENLEYYGICMFGELEKINVLTKKFSLFK